MDASDGIAIESGSVAVQVHIHNSPRPTSVQTATQLTEQVSREVNSIFSELTNWRSQLRNTPIFQHVQEASTMQQPRVLAAPDVSISPTAVSLTPGTSRSTVTISNSASGANSVVISAVRLISAPARPWITVSTPPLPISVASSESMSLSVSLVEDVVAGLKAGAHVQAIEVDHNVLDGPHTIVVTLTVPGGSGGGSGAGGGASGTAPSTSSQQPLLQNTAFFEGLGIGAGAILVLGGFCVFLQRCCRRCCSSRRSRLERSGKAGGSPQVKFSKVGGDEESSKHPAGILELGAVAGGRKGNSFDIDPRRRKKSMLPSQQGVGLRQPDHAAQQPNLTAKPSQRPTAPNAPPLQLCRDSQLDAESFEPQWHRMPTTQLWGTTLVRIPTEQELEEMLSKDLIYCMASGSVAGTDKYYLYAREGTDPAGGQLYLLEASFSQASKRLACVFKTEHGGRIDSMIAVLQKCLRAGGLTSA